MIFITAVISIRAGRPGGGVNDQGSVLLAVIIAMVIVASLGGVLLKLNANSSVTQFGSMDGFRAFYLAESGGQYAIPVINKNIDDPDTLIPMLDGRTFTFANGDRFQLALSFAEPEYTLVSTGILEQGARELNATRQITYRITKLGTQIDLPFDKPQGGKEKKQLDADLAFIDKKGKDKKPKIKELKDDNNVKNAVLEFKEDKHYMQFDWNNPDANLPDIEGIWNANNQMLSYDMQVKIKVEEDIKDTKGKKDPEITEFLVGLTFRDNGSDMYGLSFLRVDDCSESDGPPADFCSMGLEPGTLYVVLWKSIGGNYTLLESYPVAANEVDFSTLVVHVEEDYLLDEDGNRQDLDGDGYDDRINRISAFLQQRELYPWGTTDWDFDLFQEIPWDSVTDSSLTTETFDAGPVPPEIGLHSFYDHKDGKVKNVYADDFSIQFNSNSGSPSSVEQY